MSNKFEWDVLCERLDENREPDMLFSRKHVIPQIGRPHNLSINCWCRPMKVGPDIWAHRMSQGKDNESN
jgi:hypothetical protein